MTHSENRPGETALSGEELLQRIAAGQREAADEMIGRHRMAAYGVANSILRNHADAEDAVQEGFTQAFANLGTFQGRSSFKTWLLRIVFNAAVVMWRKRSRRQRAEQEAMARQPAVEWHTPFDDLGAKEWLGLVNCVLRENATPLMRLVYNLHIGEEMTYAQIASTIDGMTEEKVRNIMRQVVATLREHLLQYEDSLH